MSYGFHRHRKAHEACGPCHQRQLVDARIQHLDSQLEQAKYERTKINATMNEIHDPLYRLPREIVSRIFESGYALDTFPDEEETPFILGAVCRFWRAVAWSTPRLWTSPSFCINPPYLENALPSRLVLLDEYIERSRSLPLSIHVYADEEYEFDEEDDDMGYLINILRFCVCRWRSLDVQLPAKFLPSLDRRLPCGSYILNSLSLSIVDGTDVPTPLDITHMTTNLESLHLLKSSFSLDVLQIDYSHLKQVFASGTAEAWTNLICSASQLEEALLVEDFGSQEVPPTLGNRIIRHDSLKSLKAVLQPLCPMLEVILRHLTCPNLQTLNIDFAGQDNYPLEELLNLFGYQSPGSLRTLELWRVTASDSELKDMLVALPYLENLSIHKPENISATALFKLVFHELHFYLGPQEHSKSILPDLTTFTYDGLWCHHDYWLFLCHPTNFPVVDANSLPLVIHRQPKLKKIEADVRHWNMNLTKAQTFLDQALLDVVQALQDAGVEVALKVSGINFVINDLVEDSREDLRTIRAKAAWDDIFKKRPGKS
ncbi:hypothetical protein CPB83DRAFT_851425 [Crepidotus variabilis]|uniref:F-box domain-containing protein n=1 Tax=Crepidotus variabilis TaxID=179855 RepID=A0A9P6EHY9_9AGAR|nr:hypothetical protein CPB83DRAFT_851425 [Crepidotus variabilis]